MKSIRFENPSGFTPEGGLRTPVTPPVAGFNFAEMRRQITDGEVPAPFRNLVTPVWHNDSELWVLLQAYPMGSVSGTPGYMCSQEVLRRISI